MTRLRLVDALVAWGDVDRIVARIQAHLDAGADHVCVQFIGGEPGHALMPRWRSLAETLFE